MLRELIAKQIDPNPKLRGRMLSAILYGGAVVVKQGSLVGGSFKHIPGCTSTRELGCVSPTPRSPGRRSAARLTLVTAPTAQPTSLDGYPPGTRSSARTRAALSGGSGCSSRPSRCRSDLATGSSFRPRRCPGRQGRRRSSSNNGSYTAECAQSLDNHYLQVTPVNGAPPLLSTGVLAPDWGLHPLDANLALGNMVNLIAGQTTAYFARSGRSH